MTVTAGLDVGGAHLKVALVEDGRTVAVRQIACPLWQGMDKLEAALAEAAPLLSRATRHAVTMTGELSDLFPDRKTGVETLVARLARELGPGARYWMGTHGFGDAETAARHPAEVGSTNFLATATFVGRRLGNALLIDFGSTTADIIAVADGKPDPAGLTDADRLATGELVYTGLTRTAVMGVTTRAPFKARWQTLAREHLATMADVRRILGDLPDDVDQHATADGRGKSLADSVARFARLFGRDAADGSLEDWREAAAFVAAAQAASIMDGCLEVVERTKLAAAAPLVAAGIGAATLLEVAARLGRTSIPFGDLVNPADEETRLWATRCAPAVAVAQLADRDLTNPFTASL